jgi:ABC-2 type transport system permease protein
MMSPTAVKLVATREIREQLRGRPLWISTAITVIAIALLVVLPKVLAGGPPTYQVGISAGASASVKAAVTQAVERTGAKVDLVEINGGRAQAAAALQGEGSTHLDISVVPDHGGTVLVDRAFAATSTARKALAAQAIARAVSAAKAIEASGLPPATIQALTNPTPLPVEHLRPAPASDSKRGVAVAGAIVFFILVLRYGFGLLMGVVQEKSTRVIEVIVSAVRPIDLLTGKIAGSTVIVFGQAAIILATVLISAHAVGSDILSSVGAGPLLIAFGWVVLGFLLYATLFTGVGALASKAEDAQSVSLPLQIPLFIGYFASYTALGGDTPNTFVKVLAYVPLTAPMDMPVLSALGAARPWQVALSMAITLVAIVIAARLAAVLFSRSILRVGAKLKARDVLRESRATAA